MKKTLLSVAAALLLAGGAASAQDWQEALKKAATEAADKATGGKLTQYALVGTWNYSAPGVKFEGNDLLSQLGGSALEGTVKSQLDKVYQTVGIKPGAGSVTFGKDGAFSTQMGNYKLSGTYTFDPSTHVAAMKFAKEKLGKEKLDLGEVPGHVSLSGTKMILVFPVSKLISISPLSLSQGTRKMMTRSGSAMRSRTFIFCNTGLATMWGASDSATSRTAWWNSGSLGLRRVSCAMKSSTY